MFIKRTAFRAFHDPEDKGAPAPVPVAEAKPAEAPKADDKPADPPKPDPKIADLEKELADLRKFKDKAECDKLSEDEKLKKDAEDAKADALAARREAVAIKHGLPDALAARLQGTTKEELEADAKALAALLPKQPTQPANTGTSAGQNPPPAKEADQLADLQKQLEKATGVEFLRLQRKIDKLKNQGK